MLAFLIFCLVNAIGFAVFGPFWLIPLTGWSIVWALESK